MPHLQPLGPTVYTSSDFGNAVGWEPNLEEASEGTYYYEVLINRVSGDLTVTDEHGTTTTRSPALIQLVGSSTFAR